MVEGPQVTWKPGCWDECQAIKIAAIVVPYIQGQALDIGSGYGKVWPMMVGIDPGMKDGSPITDMAIDGCKLGMFADGHWDAVFSSHLLQHIPPDEVPDVLAEWTRILKPGGHLVLYLPSANLCPKMGEEDAHPDQKWDIYPDSIATILKRDLTGKDHGWTILMQEERGGEDEFSTLVVLRKTTDAGRWRSDLWERNPDGRKRAMVVRYGAIGDAIVTASVFGPLKDQGYHVTVNTTPKIQEVLRHDPNVDEWYIQETDFVPNVMLGPYWDRLAKRYDKFVNLSESVEVRLLAVPSNLNSTYSDGARRRVMGRVNYLEYTHDIADVPYDFSGSRFYPSPSEEEWAIHKKKRYGAHGPVIVWVVNGSSMHKVYPFVQVVLAWLIEKTPARIVLYGDPGKGREIAKAIIKTVAENGIPTDRITSIAGEWSIRESLSFARVADCIIGPETGPLNAMAMEDVPKIIYLSHSSATNLTKHWRNTVTLLPDTARVPCFPCHRMHYDWSLCHEVKETGAALCASDIKPERIFKEIAVALGAVRVS